MERSRIGLSIPLFSALVYICAMFGFMPLVIFAGYILIIEQNKTLKYHAIRSMLFLGILTIINQLVASGNNVFDIFNTFIGFTQTTFRLGYPLGLGRIIDNCVSIVRQIGLIYMALMAYRGKEVEIKLFKAFFTDEDMGIE